MESTHQDNLAELRRQAEQIRDNTVSPSSRAAYINSYCRFISWVHVNHRHLILDSFAVKVGDARGISEKQLRQRVKPLLTRKHDDPPLDFHRLGAEVFETWDYGRQMGPVMENELKQFFKGLKRKLATSQARGEGQVKVSYVIKMDQKSPYNTILQKLMTRYDDESLTMVLRAVDAEKLEKARIENWLSNGKTADDIADDIFTSLKLNTGENILMTKASTLNTWISNVELMKKPDELMISVLKKHYGDEALTNMITVAKKDYRTNGVASKLEKARLNTWLAKGESADDVFKLLKLSKEQDELLRNELMFSVLKKQYGDEGLAAIIEKGKRSRITKNAAAKLQEEVWRSEGKSSDDVFNLLFGKMKNDEMIEMFERPEFSTWISYTTKLNNLNKFNPDELVVISALEKRFDGDIVKLARALETALRGVIAVQCSFLLCIVFELQTQQFKKFKRSHIDPDQLAAQLNTKFDVSNLGVVLAFIDFYKKKGSTVTHEVVD
ncbi:hypothetical protein PHPALM_30348 [Phytophthora palmivora]|uniref:Avirulence protein (Avh) n=1 Tax=Phytophthora palmivora TaxID=4796 RepID=A0A2P4X5E6_9STRA|nr:hypothetical protein PHPALM_30348 [Phytophthora palmivora]